MNTRRAIVAADFAVGQPAWKVRDQLDQFIPADAVAERSIQMKGELVGVVERDQGCDCDQAAIALGEAGTFPDISE